MAAVTKGSEGQPEEALLERSVPSNAIDGPVIVMDTTRMLVQTIMLLQY